MTDDVDGAADPALAGIDPEALTRPGLNEVSVEDPERRAATLARELGADLVTGSDEVRACLEANGAGNGRVLTDLDGLRKLARQLGRAERILSTTEDRMVETVGARMHDASSTLAVHPETIRGSAVKLQEARTAVADAERELEELDQSVPRTDLVSDPALDDQADRPAYQARGWDDKPSRRRVVGVVVTAVGVAIALGGVGVLTIGAPSIVALAIPLAALLWGVWYLRTGSEDLEGRAEASANLAEVLAQTSQIYGDSLESLRPEPGTLPTSGGGQRRLIEGRLELARERLRSAERAWTDLVGPDADVDDLDSVLRQHDPQFFAAVELVQETPQARAAAAHHRRLRARWRVVWNALDREPPAVEDAEAAVDELERQGRTSVVVGRAEATPLVAVGTDDVGDELAVLATSRPVVVVRAVADEPGAN